ncbi:hypothetical protein [Psychrobacillus sp. FJAT-51614]
MSDSTSYPKENAQELSNESSYVENLNDENNTYDSYSELNTESESNNQSTESNLEDNQNSNGGINNSFNLSQVVDRFLNEKIITVNGVDLTFKQPLNENFIYNSFGKPSDVTEEMYLNYEYPDFRVSFYEDKLMSVAYYNLDIDKQELIDALGEPDFFYGINEYHQKSYGYSVYFSGEEHGENYIVLDFAFSADGTLEYFTIN